MLFVAHREEILAQARQTFRIVRPDACLGELRAGRREPDAQILFASVQTLGKPDTLAQFAPHAFDYVVIDEFHHAAAPSYRRLIAHFRPRFLLGLTATPERMDGGDLLALCGERLIYRADLFEGIRRGLLSPFRYFGVPDEVDYTNIPWRNGRFDPDELTARLATEARGRNALEQFLKHRNGPALGFCVSKRHADWLKSFFQRHGLRAAAVHSGPTSDPRASSLERLVRGSLDIVFSVDMFNEGVDVPAIGTVLMLRPTESPVIFLQQLGRGLRRAKGKTHLSVVDYIGNHRSFLIKARALLGIEREDPRSLRAALEQLERGALELPPGCAVTYELEALEILRHLTAPPRQELEIETWFRDWRLRHNRRPTMVEAHHAGFDPRRVRGGWFRFLQEMGEPLPEAVTGAPALGEGLRNPPPPGEALVLRAIARLEGRASEAAILDAATHDPAAGPALRADLAAVHRLIERGWIRSHDGALALVPPTAATTIAPLVEEPSSWALALGRPAPAQAGLGEQPTPGLAPSAGPLLWREYRREEIPPLFGEQFTPAKWNQGIVPLDERLVLLVTLDKSGHSASYEDELLDPRHLQWQSQNRTRRNGRVGRLLLGEAQEIHLFVRPHKLRGSRAAPFTYFGQVRAIRASGDAPITIVWELPEPVPGHLLPLFTRRGGRLRGS